MKGSAGIKRQTLGPPHALEEDLHFSFGRKPGTHSPVWPESVR